MAGHIIDSLEFDLRVPESPAAAALQHRIGGLMTSRIPALFAKVLDARDVPDMTLRIERLDLDLGHLGPDIPDDDLLERLAAELDGRIADHAARAAHPSRATDAAAPRRTGMPRHEALVRQFLHFLQTGALPWHADPADFAEPDILVADLVDRAPALAARLIRPALQAAPVRNRLVANLSPEVLLRLAACLLDAPAAKLRDLPNLLAAMPPAQIDPSMPPPGLSVSATATPLERLLTLAARTDGQPGTMLEDIRTRNSTAQAKAAQPVNGTSDARGTDPRETARDTAAPASSARPTAPSHPDNEPARTPAANNRTAPTPASAEANIFAPHPPDDRAEATPETQTTWSVQNAGLVILWPYLERYLAHIGLCADGAFLSPAHQRRAVHALQAVAVGTARYREFDLILNKALCGLDPEALIDPPPPDPEPDPHAEELLRSMIANWSRIGDTSTDGLRGSFLLRHGRLQRDGDAWRLQVERKGYDVLLDFLGYGLSMIRLPWMPRIMEVEW